MTTGRPFRFGVLAERVRSREDLVRTAMRAEAGGYSTLLIRDHFIDEPFGAQFAPIATLATISAIATTLRVGSLVLCNDFRHPVELAKEAATIDVLSGGRLELGLGAGFTRAEYERSGRMLDDGATRIARLEESIDVISSLFGPTPCTFTGAHYSVRDVDLFPKPVQRPRPPILIGGSGRRMLSVAARKADIVGLQTVSTVGGEVVDDPRGRLAATVQRKIEWIREAAGARFLDLELSCTVVLVKSVDRIGAAESLARARRWAGVSAEAVLSMPSVCIGTVEQIVDGLRERRERYGLSYLVVSDATLDVADAVVARLAGT